MTWWEYVQWVAGDDDQATIGRRAGVGQSMISRWRVSTARPESAAQFARAYHRPVLEAFVHAGFLTAEEAGAQALAVPSLDAWDEDDLLNELGVRIEKLKAERNAMAHGGQVVTMPHRRMQGHLTADVSEAAYDGVDRTPRP